jgi:hypothetical protein
MSSANTCHHVTLAKNGVAHIQRCTECGCVSVHLGPVTVRLDAEALEALGTVVGEAQVELHVRRVIDAQAAGARGVA